MLSTIYWERKKKDDPLSVQEKKRKLIGVEKKCYESLTNLSWSQKDGKWRGEGLQGRNWIINKWMEGRNYEISGVQKASTQISLT